MLNPFNTKGYGFPFIAIVLGFLGGGAHAQTSISAYLSAPQSQTSLYSNIVTETFNGLSVGDRTTDYSTFAGGGTYGLSAGNPFSVVADDDHGNGTGNYITLGYPAGTTAPFTLSFTSDQDYFGLAWSAIDANNGLTFYKDSTFIARFSGSQITTLLANTTVNRVGGGTYNSADYLGKPLTGENPVEAYAFVNFISSGGVFNKVVFDNSSQALSSGFETDNHTIRTVLGATPDNNFVLIAQVSAPEPSTLLFMFAGTVLICSLRVKSRNGSFDKYRAGDPDTGTPPAE